MKDKQRWIITGGAGFIGSNLVERLVSFGAAVLVPVKVIVIPKSV
jgi:nucleoside-diphosphate-sugar epimerase